MKAAENILPGTSLPKLSNTEYIAPNDDLELNIALNETANQLGVKRVEKEAGVGKGVWNARKKEILITKDVGKYFFFGYSELGQKWYYPEEALFLMETSSLEVFYQGAPLSIQEAYDLFTSKGLSLNCYQVFSHLLRTGYCVVRHRGIISGDSVQTSPMADFAAGTEEDHNQPECDMESETEEQDLSNCSSFSPIWQGIDIPDFSGVKVVTLNKPSKELLPLPIDYSRYSAVVDLGKLREASEGYRMLRKRTAKVEGRLWYRTPKWSQNASALKHTDSALADNFQVNEQPQLGYVKINASNWSDLKFILSSEQKATEEEYQTLWGGNVKPLIGPDELGTMDNIFVKLQSLIKSSVPDRQVVRQSTSSENSVQDLKPVCPFKHIRINYDVYLRSDNYRRAKPVLPNHRVIVTGTDDFILTAAILDWYNKTYTDSVSIHFAIADGGDVAFYAASSFQMPDAKDM